MYLAVKSSGLHIVRCFQSLGLSTLCTLHSRGWRDRMTDLSKVLDRVLPLENLRSPKGLNSSVSTYSHTPPDSLNILPVLRSLLPRRASLWNSPVVSVSTRYVHVLLWWAPDPFLVDFPNLQCRECVPVLFTDKGGRRSEYKVLRDPLHLLSERSHHPSLIGFRLFSSQDGLSRVFVLGFLTLTKVHKMYTGSCSSSYTILMFL